MKDTISVPSNSSLDEYGDKTYVSSLGEEYDYKHMKVRNVFPIVNYNAMEKTSFKKISFKKNSSNSFQASSREASSSIGISDIVPSNCQNQIKLSVMNRRKSLHDPKELLDRYNAGFRNSVANVFIPDRNSDQIYSVMNAFHEFADDEASDKASSTSSWQNQNMINRMNHRANLLKDQQGIQKKNRISIGTFQKDFEITVRNDKKRQMLKSKGKSNRLLAKDEITDQYCTWSSNTSIANLNASQKINDNFYEGMMRIDETLLANLNAPTKRFHGPQKEFNRFDEGVSTDEANTVLKRIYKQGKNELKAVALNDASTPFQYYNQKKCALSSIQCLIDYQKHEVINSKTVLSKNDNTS